MVVFSALAGGLPQSVKADVTTDNRVRIVTSLGTIDLDLFTNDAPITVANFLTYATTGDYNNVIFHRLAYNGSTPFVLQGGGFYPFETASDPIPTVPNLGTITNEFGHSNVAGTIAMAKLPNNINGASNQFFFNLSNNSSNLDNQNGGFTVFGQLVSGQTTLNNLSAIPPNPSNVTINNLAPSLVQSDPHAGDFDEVPLINYPGNTELNKYFEKIYAVVLLPNGPESWKLSTGGVWDTSANWQWGQTPLYAAVFGNNLVGAGTIDLGTSNRAVNTVRFSSGSNNGAYTLAGSGGLSLIPVSGASTATIRLDSTNSQTQTISAPISYLVNTTINNQSSGGAKLVLSGAQTWLNRTVTVSAGKVKFDNATTANAFGATLSISSGATVELAGSSSGTTGVGVANNGTLTVTGSNQSVRVITGTGNTTVAANGVLTAGSIAQASLTLQGDSTNNSGKVAIQTSGTSAAGSNTGTSHLDSLSIANNGTTLPTPPDGVPYTSSLRTYFSTLDLINNDLVITNATLADVSDMIRSGQGSIATPTWNGTGLTSSYAASNPGYALGVVSNDSDPTTSAVESPLYTSFGGITGLTGGEILVKFTYYGDLNLDGKVDSADTDLLNLGLGGKLQADGLPGWFYGDVNYDGVVNAADSALFTPGEATYTGGGFVTLPEPSSFALGFLGLTGLLIAARRRALTLNSSSTYLSR